MYTIIEKNKIPGFSYHPSFRNKDPKNYNSKRMGTGKKINVKEELKKIKIITNLKTCGAPCSIPQE